MCRFAEAVALFSEKPRKGIAFLLEHQLIRPDCAQDVADFLQEITSPEGAEFRTNRSDGERIPRATGEFVDEFHRTDAYKLTMSAITSNTPVESAFDSWQEDDKVLHSFIPSFIPSFIHSFIPSSLPSFLPSFLHPFIPSFIHPFAPSSLPSSLHPFLHPFLHDKAFVQNEFAIGFVDALKANVARSFTLLRRDSVYVKSRMIQTTFMGLLIGSLFFDTPEDQVTTKIMSY
jgi:hypothetical protein